MNGALHQPAIRRSGSRDLRAPLAWTLLTAAAITLIAASNVIKPNIDVGGLALVALVASIAALVFFLAWREGPLDPFHPILYSLWIFLLPEAVIRGTYLAFGNYSRYLALTGAPDQYLNLALIYMALAWAALVAGYYLPFTPRLAAAVPRPRLLQLDLSPAPAPMATFLIGLAFVGVLIAEGAYGSSLGVPTGNGTVRSIALSFSQLVGMSVFLLVFGPRGRKLNTWWRWSLVFAAVVVVALDVFAGGRSDLARTVILAAAAYFYSRGLGVIRWRQIAPWLAAGAAALLIGALVITQYRQDRSQLYGDSPVSSAQVVDLLSTSFRQVSTLGVGQQGGLAAGAIIDRVEGVDLLGLTLAKAPTVKTQEAQVGIANNITNELLWTFIPRVLDPGKPALSNFGLWFARIYTDETGLDWAGPTVVGDLFRNFGTAGVVLGMLLLGVYMRFIYEFLIRGMRGKALAALTYFLLLTSLNWEGEFTSFFTVGAQTLVVLVVMVGLLILFGGLEGRTPRSRNATSLEGSA